MGSTTIISVKLRNSPNLSEPQELDLMGEDRNTDLHIRVEPDSNLAPALRLLAAEPEVESVLVLTDGEIEYPAEPMPYNTLWGLVTTEDSIKSNNSFKPEYGHVVQLDVPTRK